jgi:putative transposase
VVGRNRDSTTDNQYRNHCATVHPAESGPSVSASSSSPPAHRAAVAAELKKIYTAPSEQAVFDALADFIWGAKYPQAGRVFEAAWDRFTPFFACERAAHKEKTGKIKNSPSTARLIEGQRTIGWREALIELDIAYPGRIR